MAHPYHHALSSVEKMGRQPTANGTARRMEPGAAPDHRQQPERRDEPAKELRAPGACAEGSNNIYLNVACAAATPANAPETCAGGTGLWRMLPSPDALGLHAFTLQY